MKKIIALFVILVIAFSSLTVLANDLAVTIDGVAVSFDQQPLVENGTLMLPLRAIIEKLGGKVSWHDETRTVFTDFNGKISTIQIGNGLMFLDAESITLPVVPLIKGSRTLVPVEVINHATGAVVDFNGTSVTILSASK